MSPLLEHITTESIYLPSPSSHSSSSPPTPTLSKCPPQPIYHIFFIPGNPGCISYYTTFLSLLSSHLSSSLPPPHSSPQSPHHPNPNPTPKPIINIFALSLANFINSPSTPAQETQTPEHIILHALRAPNHILGLQEQIAYVETVLEAYVSQDREKGGEGDGEPVKIIIMGHSVGAYIGMEVLRRWQERGKERRGEEKKEGEKGRMVGFVGLWPTVTWIGRSASGRKLVRLLRYLPDFFPLATGFLVRMFTMMLGRWALEAFVRMATGFPDDAAETTAAFLSTRRGVEQALYMGRDEMKEITEDKWSEDIWGSAKSEPSQYRPSLVFCFGKNDHWVEDGMRDALIAQRGIDESRLEAWKPRMVIDEEGVPHSFCIRHNSIAAAKAASFVEDIVIADLKNTNVN